MEETSRKTIILQYVITFAVCLVIAFVASVLEGLFKPFEEVVARTNWNIADERQKIFFILTNGTFISGTLCTCLGLFILAANGGIFDMLIYGVRRFISLFQKDVNKIKYKTYYDYHVAREGRPKQPFLFFVFVGLFYIGLSLIFLYFYYH